jgi:hypothetical protein
MTAKTPYTDLLTALHAAERWTDVLEAQVAEIVKKDGWLVGESLSLEQLQFEEAASIINRDHNRSDEDGDDSSSQNATDTVIGYGLTISGWADDIGSLVGRVVYTETNFRDE